MNVFLWSVVGILASTFVVETAFVHLATAKRMLESNTLPRHMKLVAYVWLPIGYLADVIFNVVAGTFTFRELPRELLFSSRVKRLARGRDGWRRERALRWMATLNDVDPDHIRLD